MKKVLFIISIILFGLAKTEFSAHAQSFDQGIINAISTGDAGKLSEYFNANIELVILDEENVYAKSQAKQILNNFFDNNPPSSFVIIHEGGKENSKFAIGTLVSGDKSYRITIYLSKNSLIHQLRIEHNNDL